MERAADQPPSRLVAKRRLVVLVAVLAAVLVTLAAVGATNDWWFLNSGSSPTPRQAPNVVKQGEWNGHPWQLSAWRSESSLGRFPFTPDGLCFSVTPRGFPDEGEGGATSCNPFAGIEPTPETKTSSEMTITFLGGTASEQLPAYIAGPVISKATAVEVRFGDGDVLRVPTFAAPRGRLRRVRFYATPLPANVQPTPSDPTWLKSVAGLDAKENVVACLAPLTATDGSSPLSDCR